MLMPMSTGSATSTGASARSLHLRSPRPRTATPLHSWLRSSTHEALLDFLGATWAPQTQGAITGLYIDVDVRVLDRALYNYDGSRFPGTLQQVDGQFGNGFNLEALIEQGGHHFTASLAFGCTVANDPACTQWHHASGGYNQNGTAGNLTFSSFQEPFHAAPQPLIDFSATGAPITFGLSLAVSGGAQGYVGAYRGQIDNFDVAICQCQ